MRPIKNFAILIIFLILQVDAYRILGIFPMAFKSHDIYFQALMRGLANRGHQVDIISHYELTKPSENYKRILNLANISLTDTKAKSDTIQETGDLSQDLVALTENVYGINICHLMAHEKFQEFIKNPPKDPAYDLIITEGASHNCYLGLGPLFNVPVIFAIANLELATITESIGNPLSSSFFPLPIYGNFEIKTFWDRLQNVLRTRLMIHRINSLTENQSGAMRKYLSPNIPSVREVEKMVALSIVNIHRTVHGIRPTTAALIEVGGLHIQADESHFTPELERWMDESKDGVVYISLGTVVPIESLPNETIKAMFSSFAKLAPVRVLIKTTNGFNFPHELPENAITMTWIPQIPVLRHNNTRLFISHGGSHSLMEAVYFGVPVIGVPMLWDQHSNVRMLVKKDMAIELDHESLTEKCLDEALRKILKEAKYREAAKNLSRLFRDRPKSPIDTATYWVEYVIRNGGKPLRSPAVDMFWWQVQLLDVYGFLLFGLVLVLYVVTMIGKNVYKKFMKMNVKSELKRD